MESAAIGGAFAIIGAVLGYLLSTLRDTRLARRERISKLRDRQIEYLIEFVAASDEVYESRRSLEFVVFQMTANFAESASPEHKDRLEARRQAIFGDLAISESKVRSKELILKLLAPELISAMDALNLASFPDDYKRNREHTAARRVVLEALFDAAREHLELLDDGLLSSARRGSSRRSLATS